MRTRDDLVYRVAKYLNRAVAGEALGDIEYATINNELQSIVDNLNRRGFPCIPDLDNIDDAVFQPLARIVASNICTDFSVPLGSLVGFEGEPRKSEVELRVLGRETFSNDTITFRGF